MFAAPDCFEQDFDRKAQEFYELYESYRGYESEPQALGDAPDDAPVQSGGAEIRAELERKMDRVMRAIAAFRDQFIGVLETLEQEAETIATEQGEDSPEFEAHERRRQEYVVVGERMAAGIRRIISKWDARDQP